MPFKFRFEVLLDLRRRERDEAGAAVGQANQAIAKIDQQRQEIADQRAALRQQSGEALVGNVSVDALLSSGRYDVQLQGDVDSILQTRRQLVIELERRQQALMLAEAEVKKYEKLEEGERREYNANQLRIAQREADDATSRKYARKIQQSRRT